MFNYFGKTLSISVTRKCNFYCTHCMVLSNKDFLYGLPNASLSFFDIEKIIEFVSHCGTQEIVLTGGEPLLVLDYIEQLQEALPENITYTVMTNGGIDRDNFMDFLQRIKVDKIVFSFDKWHERFRLAADLLEFVLLAMNRNIGCKINCVTESFDDLPDLSLFIDSGVEIDISYFVSIRDNHSLDAKINTALCRDSEVSIIDRPNCFDDYITNVVYISGFGFTPCSGHLPFIEIFSKEFVFSSSVNDYQMNKLLRALIKKNKSAELLEPIEYGDHSCNICFDYFTKKLVQHEI